MMKLKRLNESTHGAIVVDNLVIFPERIVSDDDVLFECSCVCLSDIVVHGRMKAQYNIRVLGKIHADSIFVSGKFDCSNDITCNELEVGQNCTIAGCLNSKEINIQGTLICNELGCDELSVRDQAIICSTADITGDVQAERSLICLDGITVDGAVTAGAIIAGEYADLDGKAIVLSEMGDVGQTRQKKIKVENSQPVSIAEEDPETIKDYNSPLATVLDDVAAFIENCQSLFPRESLEHELEVLRSLGSFLPSFASLYNSISSVTTSLNEKEITSWYDSFLILSDAYLALPEWMYTSKCSEKLYDGLMGLLRSYRTKPYAIKSRSMWSRSLNALIMLKSDQRITKELGDQIDWCLSSMYGKIGIKSMVVNLYLPEA